MKYISKGSGPKELRRWFEEQVNKQLDCRYGAIPRAVREKVIESLLREQGYLCCYTGIRISEETTHIEHFKPQSISKKNDDDHDDVEYRNMLAAYPKGHCPFGAQARHDWYALDLFIHPLNGSCETKFCYDSKGGIRPATKNESSRSPEKETIKHLQLDHPLLVEMRKKAIDEILFSEDEPLSRAKLQRIVEKGYSIPDGKGRYPPFCFVIEHAAREVLQKAEQERKRKQAIRKQKRR